VGMTLLDKWIAIAQACGWKIANPDNDRADYRTWIPPGKEAKPNHMYFDKPPDYFHDLNACHDMEKVALENAGSWIRYVKEIKVQSCLTGLPHFHIPAAQRAEAFGKTLGLW
jgi:hypothetical protein